MQASSERKNLQDITISFGGIVKAEFISVFAYLSIHVSTDDIGMEFAIEKSAMLVMKNEKRKIKEWIELLNQESIKSLGEKENFKFL